MIKNLNSIKIVKYAVLLIIVTTVGFPILWMIISSFKVPEELFSSPPTLFLKEVSLEWYKEAFRDRLVPRYFYNSFIVASFTMMINIIIGTLAAYSLTRFNYPGKKLFLILILAGYVIPPIILLIPLYLIMLSFGLVNQYFGLIIAHTAMTLPFSIWLLRSFFLSIPKSIEDAALIDGASDLGAFYYIMIPLARSGILSTGILVFILSWNEYLLSSVLLTQDIKKTIPVGIANFITSFDIRWGAIMALGTTATIPVVLFFFFIQKYFIKGILSGSIKG